MAGAEHFFTVNGARVASGRTTVEMYGAWSSEVSFAGATPPTGAIVLAFGNLALKGTSLWTSPYGGSSSARMLAGGDGWRKTIPAKGYSHIAGVKLSTVLADAARECGEKIEVAAASDRVIGIAYTRRADKAQRVLKHLLGRKWWIDSDGVTQIKARDASLIASPFTVVSHSGARGFFEIATENFKDWMPGRKFTAPTVTGTQTISSVSFIAHEGKIRLEVLNSRSKEERLLDELRAIVRDEMFRQEFGAIVEYEIKSAVEMEIGCEPIDKTSGWPALANVALKSGLMGETVTPTVGKKALIFFLNNDPTMYRCLGVQGDSQKTVFGSSGNIEATAGGIFKVNGGGNFVALANLVKSRLDSIQAAFDAHVHPTGVGPTGTPPPIGPLASTACTKLKTD